MSFISNRKINTKKSLMTFIMRLSAFSLTLHCSTTSASKQKVYEHRVTQEHSPNKIHSYLKKNKNRRYAYCITPVIVISLGWY